MKQVKLLIVDDSMMTRDSIERAFEEDFFAIHQASDGLNAVEMVNKFMPDVITMDMTMPNMDGVEAITTIKKNHPGAKILVISALKDKTITLEALSRGAVGFVSKPFTAEQLQAAMLKVLKGFDIERT